MLDGTRRIAVTGTKGFEDQGGRSGGCGVPAGAVAVEASLTAVAATAPGELYAYPAGGTSPSYPILTWSTGQSITNTATVNLATSGEAPLELTTPGYSAQIVVDVQGYYTVKSPAPSGATTFVAVRPCRIVDTRVAKAAMQDKETRTFAVRGAGAAFALQGGKSGGCSIPTSATGIEATVTAVAPGSKGYTKAWPTSSGAKTSTVLNFAKGLSISNTGAISLRSGEARPLTVQHVGSATHYVVDVQGYFVPPSAPEAKYGLFYVPLSDCKILNTRVLGGIFAPGETRSYLVKGTSKSIFTAQGTGGSGCGIPSGAVALAATLSSTYPTAPSYARMWSTPDPEPTATFLNAQPGGIPNGGVTTNTGVVDIRTPLYISGSLYAAQLTIRSYGTATHYRLSAQGYYVLA